MPTPADRCGHGTRAKLGAAKHAHVGGPPRACHPGYLQGALVAAAAGAAGAGCGAGRLAAGFAAGRGGGDAEELGQLMAAALFALRRFALADEQFLLAVAIATDEFVEGHRELTRVY